MQHLLAGLAALAAWSPATPQGEDDWTISADVVYTAAGEPVEGGLVRVQDGKIAAIGTGDGGTLQCAAVTPGMVDLSIRIDTGHLSVEQSSETPARLSTADSLDLFSYEWDRAVRSGITTALVSPADYDVIGGIGVVLKTGGERDPEARIIASEAVLRGAIGAQPSAGNGVPRFGPPRNFYYRRPTTRMGVEWVFRDALHDARQGVDADDPARQADQEVLRRALSGELPLAIQAKATQDVRTAVFLKEELGIPRVILDQAIEAWREPELLRRSGAAVVLPPFPPDGRHPDGFVNDSYFMPLGAAKILADHDVLFALSGHGERDVGARLGHQAGLAMRGGLTFEQALAAVTTVPATLAGVADRVGSLEVGKDADLVLWSGTPFEPSSSIVGVLLDGKLLVDPRTR